MTAQAPLPDGAQLLRLGDPAEAGRYRLVGRLGFGGMGVVYLGLDPDTGERVAVKTLHAADVRDPDLRLRFRAEADCAGKVASRRTARVLSDGSGQDPPYLVTEFIDGPTLSQVLSAHGPLGEGALQEMAIGVADALAAVHAAGIVHRDVKPSNVLLDSSGPRLIDFGIARPLDAVDGPTRTGLVVGSPGWVAPERLTRAPAATATDVFGWGQLIAYAATGRHPFGPGTAVQAARAAGPDLRGLGEPLRGLVEAALAEDPRLRPEAPDLLSTLLFPRTEQTAALAVASLWAPAGADPERRGHPWRRTTGRMLWMTVGAALTVAVLQVENLGDGSGPSHDRPEVTAPATAPPTAPSPRSMRPPAERTGPSDADAPRPQRRPPSR